MLTTLTCIQCGKTYLRESWEIKRGRDKYCSLSCYYASRKDKPFLKRRRRITKICPICQSSFESGGRLRNNKYCSAKCSYLARRQEGKISFHDQGYKMVRHEGKNYFEHRLIIEKMLGRKLLPNELVHHNNFNKEDNRPENLTVMPDKCHRRLTDHLAKLWISEHPNEINQVTKNFVITFTAGG